MDVKGSGGLGCEPGGRKKSGPVEAGPLGVVTRCPGSEVCLVRRLLGVSLGSARLVTAPFLLVFLLVQIGSQALLRHLEGAGDSLVGILHLFVGFFLGVVDGQFMAGDTHVNANLVEIAGAFGVVVCFDVDAAGLELGAGLFKFFSGFPGAFLQGIGVVHIVEMDLEG